MIFSILNLIIDTASIKELPTRIMKKVKIQGARSMNIQAIDIVEEGEIFIL